MVRQLTTRAQVSGYRFLLQRAEHALLIDQRHHKHRVEAGADHDIAQRVLGLGFLF